MGKFIEHVRHGFVLSSRAIPTYPPQYHRTVPFDALLGGGKRPVSFVRPVELTPCSQRRTYSAILVFARPCVQCPRMHVCERLLLSLRPLLEEYICNDWFVVCLFDILMLYYYTQSKLGSLDSFMLCVFDTQLNGNTRHHRHLRDTFGLQLHFVSTQTSCNYYLRMTTQLFHSRSSNCNEHQLQTSFNHLSK